MKKLVLSLISCCFFFSIVSLAQENNSKKNTSPRKATPELQTRDDRTQPRNFKSKHSLRLNKKTFKYKVIAGETFLKNEKNIPIASIFSTSYLGEKPQKDRPVLFIFNGGPGSASLWLHMGVLGPKHIVFANDPSDDGAPPYTVETNPYTLLDIADLVFIDPVGTGWSRTLGKTKGKDFWGIEEDARSIREFIRRWLTQYKRWNAPTYLVGESYGTTRAAALVRELESGWTDIPVNGIILVSSILNFELDATNPGNDVGYIGLLPSYASTAWYHGKVDKEKWENNLDLFLTDVRNFTLKEYLPALFYGQTLAEEERIHLIEKLSQFIGLSKSFIEKANLRVNLRQFRRELLRDQELSVGRFDSRFTGIEPNGIGEFPEGDPSDYANDSAFSALMLSYFINELKVDLEDPYKAVGNVHPWNWNTSRAGGMNSYVNVAPWLALAMRQNKDLRVMVANGYYDLATPFFATEITFSQPGFDRKRIEMHYYKAGHMMYIHKPSIARLSEDMHSFILKKQERRK